MRARVTIFINAPAGRIFRLLDDPADRKKWLAGLISTKQTGGTPGAEGSTFIDQIQERDRVREFSCTILNSDFPHLLAIRQETPSMSVISQWKLEPAGTGTRLVYDTETTSSRIIIKALSFIVGRLVKRVMTRQSRRIKMFAETR